MEHEEIQSLFWTSDATEKLDAALAKAQGEITGAIKNKTNPHFKSPYADLAAVWEACRDGLSHNGISVMQLPVHSTDSRLHLLTRLAHGGQWIVSRFSIPVGKLDAHGYGSALTYIKRYALKAVIGIADDTDDDGNQAVKASKNAPPVTAKKPLPTPEERLLEEKRKTLIKAANQNGWSGQDVKKKADTITGAKRELTSAEIETLVNFFLFNKKPVVGSDEDVQAAVEESELDAEYHDRLARED